MTTNEPTTGMRTTLPRNVGDNGRAALEQFGFRFLEEQPWGGLHMYVTLPQGWQEVYDSAGHHVIDTQGRRRVYINEKIAPYERYASAVVLPRFTIENDLNFERRHIGARVIVTDGDTILYASAPILNVKAMYSPEYVAAVVAARTWCDENRPEWRSPAAYWD